MQTKTKIQNIIKMLSPINEMDQQVAERLLREKAKFLSLEPKQHLFRQGVKDNQTFYLLGGSLIIDQSGKKRRVKAGTSIARAPLFPGDPRRCSAVTEEKSVILAINKKILDTALTWNQVSAMKPVDDVGHDTNTWMAMLLNSKTFMQLPPTNVQALFMLLEEQTYKPGDYIVKQGEQGTLFYVIRAGKCQVTRIVDGKSYVLATLSAGDSFGEEALLTGAGRNANVIMITPGAVMALKKEDFNQLLKSPSIKTVNKKEADEMVEKDGAQWVDVRLDSEYKQDHIKNSINIPLFMLRLKTDVLKPEGKYIVYCDTGRRSSAGTFILHQKGFKDVFYLQGGMDKLK